VHLSAAPSLLRAEPADPNPLSESSILRDPAVPALGNAKGDITIVEYFDYQCPYCKKVNPELLNSRVLVSAGVRAFEWRFLASCLCIRKFRSRRRVLSARSARSCSRISGFAPQ
jgi:hypothetical protein